MNKAIKAAICLLLIFSFTCFFPCEVSSPYFEGSSLSYNIYFSDLNLDTKSVNATIYVQCQLLANVSSVLTWVTNDWSIFGEKYTRDYEYTYLIQSGRSEDKFYYYGTITRQFDLLGYGEFYPNDKYLINLTFTLPEISFSNTSQINFWVRLSNPEFEFKNSTKSIFLEGRYDVNIQVIISRKPWVYSMQEFMMTISFMLYSVLLLIPNLKLRTSVSVPLFTFALTLFLNIDRWIPTCTFGMSFYEVRLLLFVMVISLNIFTSFIASKLAKTFKNSKCYLWYLADITVLSFFINLAYYLFSQYEQAASLYPWLDFHPSLQNILFFPLISFGLRIFIDIYERKSQIKSFLRTNYGRILKHIHKK
jgi:hypothetical protein